MYILVWNWGYGINDQGLCGGLFLARGSLVIALRLPGNQAETPWSYWPRNSYITSVKPRGHANFFMSDKGTTNNEVC